MVYSKLYIICDHKSICRNRLPQRITLICQKLSNNLMRCVSGDPLLYYISSFINNLQVGTRKFFTVSNIFFRYHNLCLPIFHQDFLYGPISIHGKCQIQRITIAGRRHFFMNMVCFSGSKPREAKRLLSRYPFLYDVSTIVCQ